MSEERIAELIAALKLPADARMVINVDMGQGVDVFVVADGNTWAATVRRKPGVVVNRRGTFKAE